MKGGHSLSELNKDGIHRIFDPKTTMPKYRLPKTPAESIKPTGEHIEGRVVGYVDLESKIYFDGETVDGPPYATSGRYFDMSTAVCNLFEESNWEIICK